MQNYQYITEFFILYIFALGYKTYKKIIYCLKSLYLYLSIRSYIYTLILIYKDCLEFRGNILEVRI